MAFLIRIFFTDRINPGVPSVNLKMLYHVALYEILLKVNVGKSYTDIKRKSKSFHLLTVYLGLNSIF